MNALKTTYITFLKSVAVITAALFVSCTNNTQPEDLPFLQNNDTIKPTEISFNTTIMLSDSALLKIKVVTPKLLRYSDEENPYVVFPDGLELILYDSLGQVESTLTANYGVNYPKEKRVEVKYNVVVKNNQGETLETEHLIWLRDEAKIYTEEHIKITTPDEILTGTGLESNESFTNYRIKNIESTIWINSDDEDDDEYSEEE